MIVNLQLGERFSNVNVNIDITTFSYRGHTSDYEYPSTKLDATISFCAPDEQDTDETVKIISEGLLKTYRVDALDYVKAYKGDHFMYPGENKQPRRTIVVRLPSGSRGIANPAYFSFK